MAKENLTPEGLPVVSIGVIDIFFRDYLRLQKELGDTEGSAKFFKGIAEIIQTENPSLKEFFGRVYQDMSPEKADLFTLGAGSMYMLLRRQGETNVLEENL